MQWKECSEEKYWDMLGAVPPAAQSGIGFLLGEPYTHNKQGKPLFAAFAEVGGKFYEFDGWMTVAAFKNVTASEVVGSVAANAALEAFKGAC